MGSNCVEYTESLSYAGVTRIYPTFVVPLTSTARFFLGQITLPTSQNVAVYLLANDPLKGWTKANIWTTVDSNTNERRDAATDPLAGEIAPSLAFPSDSTAKPGLSSIDNSNKTTVFGFAAPSDLNLTEFQWAVIGINGYPISYTLQVCIAHSFFDTLILLHMSIY